VTALLQALQGIGIAAGFVVFMYLLMWLMSRGDYDRGFETMADQPSPLDYTGMKPQDLRYLSTDEWSAFRTKYPGQLPSYHYTTRSDLTKMYSMTPQDISDMTMKEWGKVQHQIMNPPPTDFQACMTEYIRTGDAEWLTLALSEMEEQ
jgi:hypothetical protein